MSIIGLMIKKALLLMLFALIAAVAEGCAANPLIADGAGGRYVVGGVYKVKGVKYRARVNLNYVETGVASWYGRAFHGKKTANGETYNMNTLSAAHKTLPLPTYARVTNRKNGRSVIVRVNDRGPYKSDHGTDTRNRIIDVSRKAAQMLGFLRAGVAPVEVRYIGRAKPSNATKLSRKLKIRTQRVQFRPVGLPNKHKTYHVKVGSFSTRDKAETHRRSLASSLSYAEKSRLARDKKGWRLIFGPFEAKNEAQAVKSILLTRGYRKSVILAAKAKR